MEQGLDPPEHFRQVGRRGERLARIEEEIRRSQAEALGRVGERIEGLLGRLEAVDRRLHALTEAEPTSPVDRQWLVEETHARNRLRDEAVRARHHFIIQREVLGLGHQAPVEQCYPIPGRRELPKEEGDP